jgi:hypothetical protein
MALLAFVWDKILSPFKLSPYIPLSNIVKHITRFLISLRGGGILERG